MEGIAYCGLSCEVCKHAESGCKGCSGGGGDEKCNQRECCIERGLSGCWQCEGFPCHEGYFSDDAWKGLCIGLIRCVRAVGTAKTSELIRSKMGKIVDYGNYRFKREEEIKALFIT